MSEVAKELRMLAKQIEQLVMQARVASIAGSAVAALADYLTLRARVLELEAERDVRREVRHALFPGSETMSQQARNALSQLKQAVQRLSQAKDNPGQLQQALQEVQTQLQQLEQQLDKD